MGTRRIHRLLESCPLVVQEGFGLCLWCHAPLSGGNYRWCKDICKASFWQQHSPAEARCLAMTRDRYRCVICGHGLDDYRPILPEAYWIVGERIDQAREYALSFEAWSAGRPRLEVNHLVRCGRERGLSCFHHLDNLETLCRICHLAVSAAQKGRRLTADQARLLEGRRPGYVTAQTIESRITQRNGDLSRVLAPRTLSILGILRQLEDSQEIDDRMEWPILALSQANVSPGDFEASVRVLVRERLVPSYYWLPLTPGFGAT
jgi:hypothetical protein